MSDSLLMMLTTLPASFNSDQFATQLLGSERVACIQVLPQLTSHYVWKGNPEKSIESLVIIKFLAQHQDAVEAQVLQAHPYETPEMIIISPDKVNKDYLSWAQQLFS